MRNCIIEGCDKPHKCKGYCNTHYRRFWRHGDNMHNMNKYKTPTTPKYKGVAWHKASGKWSAQIKFHDKFYHLGLFINEQEAANAYDNKAIEFFGDFAATNKMLGLL